MTPRLRAQVFYFVYQVRDDPFVAAGVRPLRHASDINRMRLLDLGVGRRDLHRRRNQRHPLDRFGAGMTWPDFADETRGCRISGFPSPSRDPPEEGKPHPANGSARLLLLP